MMDLVMIVMAVAIHFISDYMHNYPDYKCPEYCEVDHEHIGKENLDVREDGSESTERE